jgi:oxygen-independent coproporphyrinogen-3 oxidase
MLGLYVHVPFCSAICNYCNFNRGLFDAALKERFVAALLEEIRRAPAFAPGPAASPAGPALAADTLYFGGGTPSLLTSADVGAIVETCGAVFELAPDAEITLEANPETVDVPLLEGFRRAGVNRLSFGVQSFLDTELQRLGRLHSAQRAEQAIEMARAAGFDNISLDLMMWLPGQDVQQWLVSLEEAIRIGPAHMSLYILEVYPHLPLQQEIERHGWAQAPDEGAAEMYESAMRLLDLAGYQQYWTDGAWCGFGPGAHSTRQGSRWRNVSATDEYINRVAAGSTVVAERRELARSEQLGDALFTGLRLNEGVDLTLLSTRYATDVWAQFGGRLAPFLEAGILLKQEGRIRLTRQGMLLANEVMAVFV